MIIGLNFISEMEVVPALESCLLAILWSVRGLDLNAQVVYAKLLSNKAVCFLKDILLLELMSIP